MLPQDLILSLLVAETEQQQKEEEEEEEDDSKSVSTPSARRGDLASAEIGDVYE